LSRGFCSVTDAAHCHVSKCVRKSCQHYYYAYHTGIKVHYIGVEFKKKAGGEKKGKIVAEIAEKIAYFIPYSEGRSLFSCYHDVKSLSKTIFSMAFLR
jgi:hypothetical protein